MHWIYEKYKELASKMKEGYTLKTDAWQEHKGDNSNITADIYLEILPLVAQKARDLGYHVVEGTIEHTPFYDKAFDVIIDTSTIDHVENYATVLDEYKRVLKDDGEMMIVVWTTTKQSHPDATDAAGGTQYYFNKLDFHRAVEERFMIVETYSLWLLGDHDLMYYKLIKGKNDNS